MKRIAVILMMVLMVSIFSVGCKKEEPSNDEDNKVEEEDGENKDNAEPSGETYDRTFPLTGIDTNETIDNRIVGVMVNNHPDARPQSGLSQADMVFEILAEGHMTRFLALFHSEQPEQIGPVRSAREYYFNLAQGYDAIYVYHGAADFVNDMIVQRGISYLNGSLHDNDGHLFKRESYRKAPHNSYLLFSAAYDVAESKGYDTTGNIEPYSFTSDEEVPGDDALQVDITYTGDNPVHSVKYVYDGQMEAYMRFSDGEQTKELATDSPIEVDNLLIVEATHDVIDDAGRRSVDLESGGTGILAQKGKHQSVRWENRDGNIVPIKDGELVDFVPGKTWVNVVPSMDQSVQITNE